MDPAKMVLKSKSSNISKSTASGRKAQHGGRKKSRSSADFPPVAGLKKRKGMYVEMRSTKISLRSQSPDSPNKQRPNTPPPRRGRNKFLSSILTILEKDTQATQTGTSNTTALARQSSSKTKTKSKRLKVDSNLTVDKIDIALEKPNRSTRLQAGSMDLTFNKDVSIDRRSTRLRVGSDATEKKEKYRSKVLSKQSFRAENEQLFIMPPKKNPAASDETIADNRSIYDEVAEGLLSQFADDDVAKQLLQELKSKKDLNNSEPGTIMRGIGQKKNWDPAKEKCGKKDKSLYSFFVDILETTFSVCNVAAGHDDGSASKNFVIDEKVAEKLNINPPQEKISYKSIVEKENTEGYDITDDGIGWDDAKTFHARIFGNTKHKSTPCCRSPSPRRRSKSPCNRNTSTNRAQSPPRRAQSAYHRPQSPYSTQTPYHRPQSAYHRPKSPYHISQSPYSTQSPYHRLQSPYPRLQSPYHKSARPQKMSPVSSRKRIRSASFTFPMAACPRKSNMSPKSQSLIMPNKSFYKKKCNNKEDLLNILRNELIKNVDPVEEPQNMFQALKIIARNKKKERKELRFADTTTEITKTGYEKPHCRCKGRKVICSSTKSTKNKKGLPSKNATRTIPTVPESGNNSETEEVLDKSVTQLTTELDTQEIYESDSYHSLEVNDYETDVLPKKTQKKDIFFAKVSNVYFDKDRDYVEEHERFENRFMNIKASVEAVFNNTVTCKEVSPGESELGSEVENLSEISISIPH